MTWTIFFYDGRDGAMVQQLQQKQLSDFPKIIPSPFLQNSIGLIHYS